jgi:hypothetical protein
MVRQRRELRLTERMATAGLVDTIRIRPAIEAHRWLRCGVETDALGEENHLRRKAAARAA